MRTPRRPSRTRKLFSVKALPAGSWERRRLRTCPVSSGGSSSCSRPAGALLATATDPITGRIGEASATIESEGEIVDIEIRQLGLGKVAGTVTSVGAPVAGAEVALTSSTGLSGTIANLRVSATTDASGGFMFDGVPVGNFTLQASVPGLLVTGTATARSIETPKRSRISSSLSSRAARFRVTCSGRTERPRCRRRLSRCDHRRACFRAMRTPPGATSSTSSHWGNFFDRGRAQWRRCRHRDGNAGRRRDARARRDLQRDGIVSGTALDSSGALLTSGRVRLTRNAPFARDVTVTVDPSGGFQFGSIPVGDYNLSLTVRGRL